MTGALLRLYHRLPAPARHLAATLRGAHLRSWRYGPETDRLVEEALARETWSADRWRAWQQERLAFILERAATRVPYYRDYWATRRRDGDRASWQYLEHWPILEKETIRQHAAALMAEDCNPRHMYRENTSGSTGTPLVLYCGRKTVRAWYALFEARCRAWYGVSRHDNWGILGGQLVTAVSQRKPPFWVWNGALHQLYLSAYHLAPDLMPYYLDAIVKYRVSYLIGYAASVNALAQAALRAGRRDLKMRVVVTNAEPLLDYQRQAIGEAFQCPVRETYGMAEMAAAASECGAGRLHVWPEVGWTEVLVDGQPAAAGAAGDLVSTTLLNEDMPLIRYRVGDRLAMAEGVTPCSCGRTLPCLQSVDGRVDDVLYTADGRQIGRLDAVFKADLPIREAQIVQETLNRLRVLVIATGRLTAGERGSIVERLQERMGRVEVILEEVRNITRQPNGKFQSVVCRLSPEDVRAAELMLPH